MALFWLAQFFSLLIQVHYQYFDLLDTTYKWRSVLLLKCGKSLGFRFPSSWHFGNHCKLNYYFRTEKSWRKSPVFWRPSVIMTLKSFSQSSDSESWRVRIAQTKSSATDRWLRCSFPSQNKHLRLMPGTTSTSWTEDVAKMRKFGRTHASR